MGKSRPAAGNGEEPVRIVPYQARWPEMFEIERAALEPVVGSYSVRGIHHLHLVPAGSPRFKDELTFRNELRRNPTLAAEYSALKQQLAVRFERDRQAYTEAKSEFIQMALETLGSP